MNPILPQGQKFSVFGHPCRVVVAKERSVWARLSGPGGADAEPVRPGKAVRVGDVGLVVRWLRSGVLRLDWDGQRDLGLEG